MTVRGPEDPPEEAERLVEALLFASTEPLDEKEIAAVVGADVDVRAVLERLAAHYEGRGVRLERSRAGWAFRTAADLAPRLARVDRRPRRLSRAALETLAVIAYKQPVTRAEIEAVRGVAPGRGVMDQLLELGLIAPRGRKDVPGRPVMWGTTPRFLDFFGLSSLDDLPRLEEFEEGLFAGTSARGDGENGRA